MDFRNGMNSEFARKFMEAKKLEKEAFMSLFPDHVKRHLNVIEKEMKEMLSECFMEMCFNQSADGKKENNKEDSGKVVKVDIE